MNELNQIKKNAGLNEDELNEEGLNGTTSDFTGMVKDMQRLMSQGKTITLVAKEAHISNRYKGEIYEYTLGVKE